jgi:hypothetical protein
LYALFYLYRPRTFHVDSDTPLSTPRISDTYHHFYILPCSASTS